MPTRNTENLTKKISLLLKSFAEALDQNRRKESDLSSFCNIINRIPLNPHVSPVLYNKQKREKEIVVFYGLFLIASRITAPTIPMAMIMATIPGSKYVSAADTKGA
jgi:hypothetical protein